MSAFTLFAAGLALVAPVIAATPKDGTLNTIPVYQPSLNGHVVAGKEFAITWGPENESGDCDYLDIVLLKGPSTNAVPLDTLASHVSNNGKYLWDVSNSLEPTTGGVGYGLKLVCTKTGDYQYSPQFEIENTDYKPSAHSSSSSASSSASSSHKESAAAPSAYHSAAPTSAKAVWTTKTYSTYTTYCPHATEFAMNNKTYTVTKPTMVTITDCPCTVTHPVGQAYGTAPTGLPSASASASSHGNHTVIQPTKPITKPASLKTSTAAATESASSTSSAAAAESTGEGNTSGAGNVKVSLGGLVFAAAVAIYTL